MVGTLHAVRAVRPIVLAALCLSLVAGCTGATAELASVDAPVTTTAAPPSTVPPALPETTTTAAPTSTTTAPPPPRAVTTQAWTPMAAVGAVVLHHPSDRVERVGFHQSNHEGAQEMSVLPTAVQPVTLESRERLTGAHSAVDVVVDPAAAIRSPVTGTVKRAGTYVLYCRYSDDYVVIAPDGQPNLEVKILHIDGEQVTKGQRVEAGVTLLAPRPTPLPFESQVDALRSADPAWPHVHIEVVDPSIPNVESPGSGC